MMDTQKIRESYPIKKILENMVPEFDLENNPFEIFKWFDATPANTSHALMNVILFLEGHPLIEYDPETGVTVDLRCKASSEAIAFSEAFRGKFRNNQEVR